MNILSNFTDYYDYSIPYSRSKIIYKRTDLKDVVAKPKSILALPSIVINKTLHKFRFVATRYHAAKWLVITGRYFLILKVPGTDTWELHFPKGEYEKYLGFENKKLIELSKEVGSPVFFLHMTKYNDFVVSEDIPRLKDIVGLPKYLNANILYQDIEYFISNTMHTNPDVSPTPLVTDKDKIVAHGFDLVSSFRHRK